MNFIKMTEPQKLMIPEAILKDLICTSCRKYLSVFPVKVFPGGISKCGRCSNDKDNGKYSMYNQLVEEYFFPCINKYEGCRKALRHFEVLEHEQFCRRRTKYDCPLCISLTDLSVMEMLIHFKTNHTNNVLTDPKFILNKRTSYIYSNDFNVFQICVTKPIEQYANIRVKVLGHQKYVRHVSITFNLALKCSGIETGVPNLFEVNIPLNNKLQSNLTEVEFYVHYDGILYNDFHFSPTWVSDSESTCEFLSHELLEILSCTLCKKYLSVSPVKIYPRGTIKCGRCSIEGDEGVPSLYNQIIEGFRFPSIRKYDDGSTEDLRSCEILSHEKKCRGTLKQICPMCTSLLKLTSYEMLIHFKLHHSSNILKKPKFFLKSFCSYLYFNEFHVFIIKVLPLKTQFTKVVARVLGGDTDDVSITFSSNQHYTVLDTESTSTYAIIVSRFSAHRTEIKFNINYNKNRMKYTPNWCPFHGFIRLTKDFRAKYPNYIYSEDTYCFQGTHTNKLIQLYCKRCGERYGNSLNYDGVHDVHICDNCAFLENSYRSDAKEKVCKDQALSKMYGALGVRCRYGCNGIFNLVSYVQLKHEHFCDRRPPQNCPMEFCNWEEKVLLLELHFKIVHSRAVLAENNVFTYEEISEMCENGKEVFVRVDNSFFRLTLVVRPEGDIFITTSTKDSCDKCDLITRNSKKQLQHSKEVYLSPNEYLIIPKNII